MFSKVAGLQVYDDFNDPDNSSSESASEYDKVIIFSYKSFLSRCD